MRIAPLLLCVGLAISGCSDSHSRDDDGGPLHDAAPMVFDTGAGSDSGATTPECDGPSQCLLRPESCCGACGAATPEDMIAIPVAEQMDYVARVCAGIGCPECAARQDPYLLATCRDRRCVAIDLHVEPLTECITASDCTLAPLQCCACGLLGPDQVVAYNPANGSIASLVCDPDLDCPPCVPDFGATSATCEAGRCVVVP